MSYKALLFCPDEKTARVVTQVLSDLEFRVEPCNEPFTAVKKLMAEHFDAIVVDCDNEQNAALLFKSAHNSGSNEAALAVAVVEGQSGVAKAFRIGANLVLTKPINVEQSKGTLRVARGLLRKNEAARPAGAASAPPRNIPSTSSTVRPPAGDIAALKPAVSSLPVPPPTAKVSAVSSSLLDVEEDPITKPEPEEAAFLESVSDPLKEKAHTSESASAPAAKEYPWQPVSKPMAGPMVTALRHAAEAAGKPAADSPLASSEPVSAASITESAMGRSYSSSAPGTSSLSSSISSGHGAAAAPAKIAPLPHEEEEKTRPIQVEAPTFGQTTAQTSGGSNKTILIIAAVVVAAAAIGYVGWTKMHPATSALSVQPIAAPVQIAPAPTQTQPEAAPPSSLPMSQAKPAVAAPSQPVAPTAHTSEPTPEVTLGSTNQSAAKKSASLTAPNTVVRIPAVAEAPAPLVIKKQSASATPAPPQETAQAPSLGVVGTSGASDQAISGIMSTSAANLPRPALPQTLKVSQGVSQGLLVKRVQPVYPQLARQMHLQGAVELMAKISKTGDITEVKLLNGDSVLSRAAIDAVKQWKYKPYYLDSQPVEIQTQITVNFKLP